MATMYGFEARTHGGQWMREAAGQQDVSNLFETRESAEAEIPALARALECSADDVRVVEFDIPNESAARSKQVANYMVCDGDGTSLAMGLQEQVARKMAQDIANRLGEPVWLSEEGREGDERIAPETECS